MSKFQILTGYVNLGGSHDAVVFRGHDAPLTLAESHVLAAIHGGDDHVHGLVVIGVQDRDMDDEFTRLKQAYGEKLVASLFPPVAGRTILPTVDDRLPTEAEVAELADASAKIKAKQNATRAKQKTTATAAAVAAATAPAPVEADASALAPSDPASDMPSIADLPLA